VPSRRLGSLATFCLAKARDAADECRRQRRAGHNPIAASKARQAAENIAAASILTFKDCAEQSIAAHEVGWRNANRWSCRYQGTVGHGRGD
jgi:hypothetical protein